MASYYVRTLRVGTHQLFKMLPGMFAEDKLRRRLIEGGFINQHSLFRSFTIYKRLVYVLFPSDHKLNKIKSNKTKTTKQTKKNKK